MARNSFLNKHQKLILNLGLGLVKFLGISWRFRRVNPQPVNKVIYAFWHRNIITLMYMHKNQNLTVLISQSKDGQLIADACTAMGYSTVRGSSSKGGSKALKQMISIARHSSIVFTPDGPKGPAREFKDGLIFAAKITRLPIVLIAADARPEITFNSWDKFRMPLPFARIKVIYDQPFFVDKNMPVAEAKAALDKRMKLLEAEVEAAEKP